MDWEDTTMISLMNDGDAIALLIFKTTQDHSSYTETTEAAELLTASDQRQRGAIWQSF